MDIHVLWISVFSYPCFYGYRFGYPWISMDIHTCIDLLWILDPGHLRVTLQAFVPRDGI